MTLSSRLLKPPNSKIFNKNIILLKQWWSYTEKKKITAKNSGDHTWINKKKKKIAEAAFLIAFKKGINNLSIKEIQETSGLSTGTIYHYFNDKEEILLYMVNIYLLDKFYEFRQVIIKSNDSFIKRIESSFYLLHDFNKKDFDSFSSSIISGLDYEEYFGLLFTIVLQHPKFGFLLNDFHKDSYNFYRELVEEAIKNKEINEEIDAETLTMFIHAIFTGYLHLWVFYTGSTEYMNANLKTIKEIIKK